MQPHAHSRSTPLLDRRAARPHAVRNARSVDVHVLEGRLLMASTSALWGDGGERFSPAGRLMDWSFAGYHAGQAAPPSAYAQTRSVKDFGAKGDGKTDDTAAVLRALNEVESIGSADRPAALVFPAGTYVIKKVLKVDHSGVVLKGDGQGQTTLYFPTGLNEVLGNDADSGGDSEWAAKGAFLWFEGADTSGQRLADVTAAASRGDRTLKVSSTSGLAVGQQVRLSMTDSGGSLVRALHGGYLNGGSGLDADEKVFDTFTSRITSISGNTVVLERALPIEVRTEWKPRLERFAPAVREVGVEGMTLRFDDGRAAEHHREDENAVFFRRVADAWARDVNVYNADNAFLVKQSNYVTVGDVRVTAQSSGRANSEGDSGHHGLSSTDAGDVLFTRFDVAARYRHGLDVDQSFGNVFADGRGVDLNMGHHRRMPYGNLFTDLDLGGGGRAWETAGEKDLGPFSGAYETFWNVTAGGTVGLPEDSNFGAGLTFVGVKGAASTPPSWAKGWFIETMAPDALAPQNLYAAQLAKRLGGGGVGTPAPSPTPTPTPTPSPTPTPTPTPVPAPTGDTTTAKSYWRNLLLPEPAEGRSTLVYEVRPTTSSVNGVSGPSAGSASSLTSMPLVVRFNSGGYFDASSGSGYRYTNRVKYQSGQTYTVRVEVDAAARRYDVFVRPSGGAEVQIANDFAFRRNVSYGPLTHLGFIALSGTFKIGNAPTVG